MNPSDSLCKKRGHGNLDYFIQFSFCWQWDCVSQNNFCDGIVTQTVNRGARKKDNKYAISREKMISAKYRQTIHVDNDMLIVTGDLGENGSKFKKYDLKSTPEDWSVKAVEALEQIVAEDGKKQ